MLGQVIPGGSESPFCAAGLRQCWAWNPITSAAMLALWHQTPSMQNATASVYQQCAPQFSYCRGVHWWVACQTRSRRDDTGDTDEGQTGEEERGRVVGEDWGGMKGEDGVGKQLYLIIRVCNYCNSCWWTVSLGRRDGGEQQVKGLGHEGMAGRGKGTDKTAFHHQQLLLKVQCTQNWLPHFNSTGYIDKRVNGISQF